MGDKDPMSSLFVASIWACKFRIRIPTRAGESKSHGEWVGGFGSGPGGDGRRRVGGQRNCALGGPGAACGGVGIQTVLARGGSSHSRSGLFGHRSTDRARGGSDEDHSRGQRRHYAAQPRAAGGGGTIRNIGGDVSRSEEHTSELQSLT